MPTAPISGQYTLVVEITNQNPNPAGNYTDIEARIRVVKNSGSGYWSNADNRWEFRVNGVFIAGGSWQYDFRGTSEVVVWHGFWRHHHNANGTSVPQAYSGGVSMSAPSGSAVAGDVITPANFSRTPSAPRNPRVDQVRPTSARYRIDSPASGAPILQYRVQYSRSSDFKTGTQTITQNGTEFSLTGLSQADRYFVRSQARNAQGWGAWSAVSQFNALPSGGPTILVVPTPAGSAARVRLFPPGSAPASEYEVTREYLSPDPKPSPVSVTYKTKLRDQTVGGLIPGGTYRWRARATIDGYVSAWSGWVTVAQPRPNLGVGQYFDGSTTNTPDVSFVWSGTAHASIARAISQTVQGMVAEPGGSSATFTVSRVTDTMVGQYAALAIVQTNASAAGAIIGQANSVAARSAIVPNQPHFGSILVRLDSRSQRMAARIYWLDPAGNFLSATNGDAVVVAKGVPTRLTVSGSAPEEAAYAYVRAYDAAGSGWSAWRSGDRIVFDAIALTLNALYPYFDGDTVDGDGWAYAWTGLPNESTSYRFEITDPDPLVDPDCLTPPPPPRPPIVPSDCIDDVGQWNRYWSALTNGVYENIDSVVTLQLTTKEFAVRQLRVRYYPNPFGRSPDSLPMTSFCAEQVVSYLPPNTVLTIDGISGRAWAEVNGAPAVPADHLLYGTGGMPPTWPELACGVEYVVTVDVPVLTPPGSVEINADLSAVML